MVILSWQVLFIVFNHVILFRKNCRLLYIPLLVYGSCFASFLVSTTPQTYTLCISHKSLETLLINTDRINRTVGLSVTPTLQSSICKESIGWVGNIWKTKFYFLMLFRTINYSIINDLGFILIVISDLGNLLILPICTFVSSRVVHSYLVMQPRNKATQDTWTLKIVDNPWLSFEFSGKRRD